MIARSFAVASRTRFDVAVIGGGILGACHALEATRRGLSVLLVEQADFGAAVSWSSHRIIHGGLRYVQSLDFPRQIESIEARRWFLENFPDHVRPLTCLMPLYNRGLKRTATFRAAFLINDTLSARRNTGLPAAQHIPAGRILSTEETRRWFPGVVTDGLKGAALWHDAYLCPPQRVLMEILRWAASGGAIALNYARVERVTSLKAGGHVLHVTDATAGGEWEVCAQHVINCAGAAAAQLHEPRDAGPAMSLAFSVVLDRPAVSRAAVAVSPRQSGNPMYFVVPYNDRILAGTIHLPCPAGRPPTGPADEDVAAFLRCLNEALPDLQASPADVLRVFSGLLPAHADGRGDTLSRPVRRFHIASRPASQFLSIWGVKYTTARHAAVETMKLMFPSRATIALAKPAPVSGIDFGRWVPPQPEGQAAYRKIVRRVRDEESVVFPEDLLMRRTDWGTLPPPAGIATAEVAALLDPAEPATPETAAGARRHSP